ncbi:haloacid dehalogenase-like hydrolase [Mycoplasma sp. CAG:877]|nr:haloacid dehalogenase-like hydrolase [Mycoplasma sp. CAG:877]
MYKLLVSDFDGTLVGEELAISFPVVLAIDKIRREKKVLFTIATSRCLGDILYYNRDFSFLDYVVASNGAVVYDVNKEKILFKKSVLVSNVKKIYNTFKGYDIYACRKDRKFRLVNLEDIKDIYKLEIVCKSDIDREEIISRLNKLCLKITCTKNYINGTYYVDIVYEGINKFTGVEVICNKKKIDICDVISIGEGDNDIELVRDSGYGVSTNNGIDKVKEVSKEVMTNSLDKWIGEKFK